MAEWLNAASSAATAVDAQSALVPEVVASPSALGLPVWEFLLHGERLFAVVCEDDKGEMFQHSNYLAQVALGVECQKVPVSYSFDIGMLGQEMCDALSRIHPREMQIAICEVTSGRLSGLRVIGIGWNKVGYDRASKVALAVAVMVSSPADLQNQSDMQWLMNSISLRQAPGASPVSYQPATAAAPPPISWAPALTSVAAAELATAVPQMVSPRSETHPAVQEESETSSEMPDTKPVRRWGAQLRPSVLQSETISEAASSSSVSARHPLPEVPGGLAVSSSGATSSTSSASAAASAYPGPAVATGVASPAPNQLPVWECSDGEGGRLFAVVCEDDKSEWFQQAKLLAQVAVRAEGKSLPVKYSYETSGLHPELLRALNFINSVGMQTVVCEVASGPFVALKVIGIGWNKVAYERASSLALAVAVMKSSPPIPEYLKNNTLLQRLMQTLHLRRALASQPALPHLPDPDQATSEAIAHWSPLIASEEDVHQETDAFDVQALERIPPHPREFEIPLSRLAAARSDEIMTIASITSKDTIPLGTDLDPAAYKNDWAGRKVTNPLISKLVKANLGFRVIDAENVGFAYGQNVKKKQGCFCKEGVEEAVKYFSSEGIISIVISKRPGLLDQSAVLKQAVSDGYAEIVTAERTDDVILIKEAFTRNCPIVSRDGFAEWKEDPRIGKEIRDWFKNASDLQVRYSWSIDGRFIADFDHPRPILNPNNH